MDNFIMLMLILITKFYKYYFLIVSTALQGSEMSDDYNDYYERYKKYDCK